LEENEHDASFDKDLVSVQALRELITRRHSLGPQNWTCRPGQRANIRRWDGRRLNNCGLARGLAV